MEATIPRSFVSRLGWSVEIDGPAVWIWALTLGLMLYLGLNGGGYDLVVRSDAAIAVWWIVLLGALAGVLPAARLTRPAWAALGLLGAFVVWTAISTTWSLSTERSLEELSRIAGYLGVLALAVAAHGDRRTALRHVVGAVAAAAVVLAGLAVLSRLRPGMFPAAHATSSFLPGTQARLSWPLNYWNALGALVALALPLLFAIATTARRLAVQAVAAAGIPLVALCGYLTFSRGGAIAGAVAVIVFLLLAPDRIPKCATLLLSAAASAALIAGAAHRHALERGLTGPAADHQGRQLLLAVVLVCAGAALGQAAIGLAARHAGRARVLEVPPRRAGMLAGAAVAVLVVVAVAAGAPHRLDHAWQRFKQPNEASLHTDTLARFGSLSGNGRYTYWRTSIDALPGHVLGGYGPGTFQLVWLPRARISSYARNAHSLYVETLLETGAVGLALLGGFIVLVLGAALRAVLRSRDETRTYAAGASAALVAFAVSAAFDWIWQVPVLPVAVLLLAGAVLAPTRSAAAVSASPTRSALRFLPRGVLVAAAVGSLVAVAIPLAVTDAVRSSQAEARAGDDAAALADARRALAVEPHAASAELQVALLLEANGRVPAAVAAARRAVRDEAENWQTWLVLSRLSAENGDAHYALIAYRRARALNPQSPLFQG